MVTEQGQGWKRELYRIPAKRVLAARWPRGAHMCRFHFARTWQPIVHISSALPLNSS